MSGFAIDVNSEHNRVHHAVSLYCKRRRQAFHCPQDSTAVRIPEAVVLEELTCTHTQSDGMTTPTHHVACSHFLSLKHIQRAYTFLI